MIGFENIRRGIMRSLGVVATAAMVVSAAPSARAVSLIGPGSASATRDAPAALVQVRGGHGGFHGGGFHGGGGFRGGGFRYAAPARVYGYGYRRYVRPRYYGYAPSYSYGPRYYQPRRFCRIVPTYYGYRRVCRLRPWFHPHRRHHYWRGY